MTETLSYIRGSLRGRYPASEIQAMTRLIMERVCHLMPHRFLSWGDKELPPKEKEQIHLIVERLKRMEPIQYILGRTEFCGLMFQVNPSVLIPRPETEELTGRVLADIDMPKTTRIRLLDIGTGCGCIAVALKRRLPFARVTALDLSKEALAVARRNARRNGVRVSFVRVDMLDPFVASEAVPVTQDVMVSNPPYVREGEKREMERNVRDYEPACALFVPDDDPLLFYRSIALFARQRLRCGGRLYFEINEAFGGQTVRLLREMGFEEVELFRDFAGKDRFVRARR